MGRLKRPDDFSVVAETLAQEHMRRQGYTVREYNWRPGPSHKEIDIIAQKGETMVFVEVKGRAPDGGDPLRAITPKKIRNMVACAKSYLATLEQEYAYRFDVVTVVGTTREDCVLEHIEDAFLPPLTTR